MDDESDSSPSLSPSVIADLSSSISGLDLEITPASPPFDGPEGDVILRTSDSVDFWVLRAVLGLASPVFKTMFTLPQPTVKQEEQTQPPIIPISELSRTIDLLLRLCYPIEAPRLSDQGVTLIGDVLGAALKYEIGAVVVRTRKALKKCAERSSKNAIAAYAIACHLKLADEARVAAMACLKWPFPGPTVPQLALMSGLDYYNLLQYHRKVAESIVGLFTKNRYIFVTSTCAPINPRSHTCSGSKKLSYTINNEIIDVVEYIWWSSSKTVLCEVFKVSPLATEKLSLWTLAPILEATECHICKNTFLHGWDKAREAIIAEMRKKAVKVELSLSWK
ncbi:hypothetical protein ACEPAH_3772 [Sanghuangporus vaninii]